MQMAARHPRLEGEAAEGRAGEGDARMSGRMGGSGWEGRELADAAGATRTCPRTCASRHVPHGTSRHTAPPVHRAAPVPLTLLLLVLVLFVFGLPPRQQLLPLCLLLRIPVLHRGGSGGRQYECGCQHGRRESESKQLQWRQQREERTSTGLGQQPFPTGRAASCCYTACPVSCRAHAAAM